MFANIELSPTQRIKVIDEEITNLRNIHTETPE